MSHRLSPRDGQAFHEPEEIARRWAEEFECCDVDAEQGKDDVGTMLAKFIELNAPQEFIDEAMRGRERSLRITVMT